MLGVLLVAAAGAPHLAHTHAVLHAHRHVPAATASRRMLALVAVVRLTIVTLSGKCALANRTQALVLGFFLLVWASLVAILAMAPAVYDQALRLPPGDRRPAELAFLAALSAFVALLGLGVLRRWRWTFWLIVVAFLFGVLRVPASILELTGVLPAAGPTWYVLFQALVGLLQFAIGLAMLVGYRRAGVWGEF